MGKVEFCEFDKGFLEKSYQWLSDPQIKRLTLAPEKITKDDQNTWFKSLEDRNDYLIWGVKYQENDIGAVGFKNIDNKTKTAEYFGYIGEKEYWGKGIGSSMLEYAIQKAKEMDLCCLNLNVSKDNERAINLYKKFGFEEYGGITEKEFKKCLLST